MDLILPIAGRSSRYPGLRPKWSLTMPTGRMMFEEVMRNLTQCHFQKKYVVCVEEQVKSFTDLSVVQEIVREADAMLLVLPNHTNSQAETIKAALQIEPACGSEGFFIKDCDNLFDFTLPKVKNFVSVQNLHEVGRTNAANKSYVRLDEFGRVVSIEEKRIISDLFCSGGYAFESRQTFIQAYNKITAATDVDEEIYISHVIHQCLLDGIDFYSQPISNYVDLGTHSEYLEFTQSHQVIFCDIDGVLLKNGGRMHPNGWETPVIESNVEHLKKLQTDQGVSIYLTTSRNKVAADYAVRLLSKSGLVISGILHSLPHGKRILINDFSPTNPFPSAISINLNRDSNDLDRYLR